MANRSQCPDYDPHSSATQMYSEVQRLALEELVAAGHAAFHAFLRREKARVFLSEPEICAILRAAALAPGAEEKGAAAAEERNGNGNASCRLSLAYFPVRSDLEPPAPELGWPTAFGSRLRRRGPAEVEAFFQPGFGETVYPCKEAVRKQICSAKEVIAIVMDIFTDIDIFSDLLEACQKRRVRVYILLDETFFLYFLKMCHDFGIDLENEKLLRVRSITGKIFYTRSGIKLVGKAHEKFMLVDNIRVTTGSYSFTWTDGNLSSSNIVMLSGCAVAQFELRFWILYAQSKCSNAKRLVIYKNYKSEQFSRKAKPSNTLSIINVKRMDFFHFRTLSANVLNKHELLQLSRDTRYKSNIEIKMSPEFTKTNQSLFLKKIPTVKTGFISETYCAKCLQCD